MNRRKLRERKIAISTLDRNTTATDDGVTMKYIAHKIRVTQSWKSWSCTKQHAINSYILINTSQLSSRAYNAFSSRVQWSIYGDVFMHVADIFVLTMICNDLQLYV